MPARAGNRFRGQLHLWCLPQQLTAAVVSLCRGYVNTSAVKSAISYIDGDKGILRYRGYPIEQLAEKSNFTEVSSILVLLKTITSVTPYTLMAETSVP